LTEGDWHCWRESGFLKPVPSGYPFLKASQIIILEELDQLSVWYNLDSGSSQQFCCRKEDFFGQILFNPIKVKNILPEQVVEALKYWIEVEIIGPFLDEINENHLSFSKTFSGEISAQPSNYPLDQSQLTLPFLPKNKTNTHSNAPDPMPQTQSFAQISASPSRLP
jgi:hypothetical protein